MLARQTRRSISLHQTSTLGLIARSARCSALQSVSSTFGRRCVVTKQFRPWKRRGSEAGHGISQGRNLATAVDDYKFNSATYDHLASPDLPIFNAPSPQYYNLRSFDSSSPLRIPEPEPRRAASKWNIHGIPGDNEEVVPVFDACVRVGKLERAAMVLKRLKTMGTMPGEEQIILHNQYLRASLDQMRTNPDRKQAEQLHKWYELQIRNQDMPQTAETIACMLKASLLSERGARLERLVNRYMSMAPGEAGLRVLSMAEILSDQDLAVITEICPTYNFAPESEDAEPVSMASEQVSVEGTLNPIDAAPAGPYPEIAVTPQRGEGLTALKQSLGLMMELEDVDISKLSVEEQYEFQSRLEKDSIEAAIGKWREDHKHLQKMGVNTALSANTEDGSLSQNLPAWFHGMETRLRSEMEKIEASENAERKSEQDLERCIYGPFIRQADPTRLAAVTILCVLNQGAMIGVDKGVVLSRLINDIARVAQEDIQLQQRDNEKKEYRRRRKIKFTGDAEAAAKAIETRPVIAEALETAAPAVDESNYPKPWSLLIKSHVGSILLKALIETAKVKVVKQHPTTKEMISQFQPAFSHMQKLRKGKKVGVLILNSQLVERMMREPVGDFIAKHLPMVAQPKPWRSMYEGGFLESRSSFVRLKPGDVEQKLYTNAAIKRGDMEQVFKGVDVLGETPWRINKDVLDVMVEAWNSGVKIANIPPLDPELQLPTEPESSADPLVRRAWLRTVKAVENERSGLHSQRCYMNLQLEIARAFRNQTIYFPHNVDYRGRAYPMPTYLNHMGADHTRSILKFANGKELGASGLRWLKIHLANVYGFDKASFDEREAFANDNVANIIESATNPLKGSRWWLNAEDPWQCLASCFELKAALDLPDPTKFVSQLPVHQDGTCNGLQHYAALGGDTWGAKQVNLMPGDRPADVYSAVANLVKESIAKDANTTNARLVEAVTGKITRKVVKQTVMTNVYGVTFAGAKKQVCKQIDSLYPNLHKECGIPHLLISTYIARHIFNALATMFRGAHDIQFWLGEIGGRVCRALTPAQLQEIADAYAKETGGMVSGNQITNTKKGRSLKAGIDELTRQFRSTVVWTTPLRMPVAQPYRKTTMKEIRTCLQAVMYPISDQTDPVNRRKQLQGFPPNFIHSLDATHMLLSAIQCRDRGLDFAAVHDSFWTHAADVDSMNEVIRDSFIRIHEEDVVGRLAAEFNARYKGSLYLTRLDRDSAVAQKIMDLRKNSTLSAKEELLLEHKRNTLRLSGTPWDLEAAEKIVTPASIFEEMAEVAEAAVVDEDAEEALGAVPDSESKMVASVLAKETQAEPLEENEDADDLHLETADFGNGLMESINMSKFEQQVVEHQPLKKSTYSKKTVDIWLPLSFPAIPKKGDFDVSQLRESKYFFS
ncbi:hypothetical protein G7046_g758 [Stylonectria norvegica]|nr:hypothetical protein G7046_g758 [Stylonectria norvegica]